MSMIFCKYCENMRVIDCGGDVGYHCKINTILMHNFMKRWQRREQCEVKNRNNDCVDFKSKRRLKIWPTKK